MVCAKRQEKPYDLSFTTSLADKKFKRSELTKFVSSKCTPNKTVGKAYELH